MCKRRRHCLVHLNHPQVNHTRRLDSLNGIFRLVPFSGVARKVGQRLKRHRLRREAPMGAPNGSTHKLERRWSSPLFDHIHDGVLLAKRGNLLLLQVEALDFEGGYLLINFGQLFVKPLHDGEWFRFPSLCE